MPDGLSEVIALADGRLYALVHPYELDGRPSSHPVGVRGWSTMNCYLLIEPDRAVLYSTGYTVHEAALLAQLDELVEDRPLSLIIARIEFPAMCNARPIAQRFAVDTIYQPSQEKPHQYLNIRPESEGAHSDGLRKVRGVLLRSADHVRLDTAGEHRLVFRHARATPPSRKLGIRRPDANPLHGRHIFMALAGRSERPVAHPRRRRGRPNDT